MALSDLTPAQRRFLEAFVLEKPMPAAFNQLDAKARASVRQVQAELAELPPRAAALIKDERGKLDRAVAQIDRFEAAGDIEAAARELRTTVPLARETGRHIAELRSYLSEANDFAKRLGQARGLKGAGGMIDDYVVRMEADEGQRQAAEARGDFDTALSACRAEASVHAAMMREAEQATDFNAVRDATQTVIARLKRGPADTALQTAIDEAEAALASGQGFGDGGNWSGALAVARQARDDLSRAETAAGLRRKAAVADLATNEKLCRALLSRYRKSPGASPLLPQLKAASARIDAARKALPDETQAAELMADALHSCTALEVPVARAGDFAREIERLVELRRAMEELNIDSCVAVELAAADGALRRAARMAKTCRFDTAAAPLAEADAKLRAAAEAAKLYRTSVRKGRLALAQAISADGVAVEDTQRHRAAFEELTAAFVERDLARAARLAAAAGRQDQSDAPSSGV